MPANSLRRVSYRLAALALLLVAVFARPASAKQTSYPQALDLAVAAMEEGKHIQALSPMRIALSFDRSEPYGVIALGTLYLHAGSPARAAQEFARAHDMLPNEPLAVWGQMLAALAQNKHDPAAFTGIPPSAIPSAPSLSLYVRLISGQVLDVREATKNVTPDEKDPLLLEIAGFAALRGGEPARGETLLNALLARPDMKPLTEDRAFLLMFQRDQPAQGGAPPLSTAIGFPEPVSGFPLSGIATMSPPFGMPSSAAMVTYSTEGGGGWTTTTNNPPFAARWDTSRFPNGPYTVHTVAYDAGHNAVYDSRRTFVLNNEGAPPSTALSPQERAEMRERLLVLLTPRPSRKAAWFALYEQAKLHGDDTAALSDLEAVVAIDPHFQEAYTLLREARGDYSINGPISWWSGVTKEKVVALTFDDGPNPLPARTPALLDAMEKLGIHVTFFVIGARAEQCTDILKRMDADGHEIADHSYSHPNLTYLDPPAVERELGRTAVIIRQATGKRPQFYRPPGGNYNRAVTEAAGALGMAGAYWSLDALKFENDPFTPEALTKYVLNGVHPGSIVLLHNAPENTIRALPAIVAGLRAKGYRIVTMSELAQVAHPGPIPREAASYGYH